MVFYKPADKMGATDSHNNASFESKLNTIVKLVVKDYEMKKLAILIATAALAVCLLGCVGGDTARYEDTWADTSMADILPAPPCDFGEYWDSDEYGQFKLKEVSASDYEAYRKSCETAEFIIDAAEEGGTYRAFNDEGYCLELDFWDSELYIVLHEPLVYEELI